MANLTKYMTARRIEGTSLALCIKADMIGLRRVIRMQATGISKWIAARLTQRLLIKFQGSKV